MHVLWVYFLTGLGACVAALSIETLFVPNHLIDGGIVGIAMLFGKITDQRLTPVYFTVFSLPFVFLAWKNLGKTFVGHMCYAVALFSLFSSLFHGFFSFEGTDSLEVIVIAGVSLGVGVGLIIRSGGCLDGTEILGIILNKRRGYTVGQVVFFINIFIFAMAGIVYRDWHTAIQSLMTFFVVMKVMDTVIVGLEETKAVYIISEKIQAIADTLMHDLGLGLTLLYGRGGFTKKDREIIYLVVERLQLAKVKELVYEVDPRAFVAIENLHEVVNGTYEVKKHA